MMPAVVWTHPLFCWSICPDGHFLFWLHCCCLPLQSCCYQRLFDLWKLWKRLSVLYRQPLLSAHTNRCSAQTGRECRVFMWRLGKGLRVVYVNVKFKSIGAAPSLRARVYVWYFMAAVHAWRLKKYRQVSRDSSPSVWQLLWFTWNTVDRIALAQCWNID